MDNFGEQVIFSELELEQLFSTRLDYTTNACLPLYAEQAHLFSSPYSSSLSSPTTTEGLALSTEHLPYINSHTPNAIPGGAVAPSMADPGQCLSRWGRITPSLTRGTRAPVLRLQTQYHTPHGLPCGWTPDLEPSSVLPDISGISPSVSSALTPPYTNIAPYDPWMSHVLPMDGSAPAQNLCASSDGENALLGPLRALADYDCIPFVDSQLSITSKRVTNKAASPIQPALLPASPPGQDSCTSSPGGDTSLLSPLGALADYDSGCYERADSQPSNASSGLTHTTVSSIQPVIRPPPTQDSCAPSPNEDTTLLSPLNALANYDYGCHERANSRSPITSGGLTHPVASSIQPATHPALPPAQDSCASSPNGDTALLGPLGALADCDFYIHANPQLSVSSGKLTHTAVSSIPSAIYSAPPPTQDSCASSFDGDTALSSSLDSDTFANYNVHPRVDPQLSITPKRLMHGAVSPAQCTAHSNGIHKRACGPLQRQPRVFWCLWLTDGTPCEVRVVAGRRKVFEHLQRDHGIKPGDEKSRQTCHWKGCMAIMNKESLARHIWSVHLKERAHCAECGLYFAREDSLKRHLKGGQHKESCDKSTT